MLFDTHAHYDDEAFDPDRELLLEFSGEMDHHGARNALKEVEIAIDAALPRSLILDFAGVTFMDSSGIGLIMGRYRAMGMRKESIRATGVSRHIDRLLHLSGLHRYIEIQTAEEEKA